MRQDLRHWILFTWGQPCRRLTNHLDKNIQSVTLQKRNQSPLNHPTMKGCLKVLRFDHRFDLRDCSKGTQILSSSLAPKFSWFSETIFSQERFPTWMTPCHQNATDIILVPCSIQYYIIYVKLIDNFSNPRLDSTFQPEVSVQ